MKEAVALSFATLLSGFISFFGGYDSMLKALILFVIIDFITGLMRAIINKEISKQVSYVGVFKKVALFIMVGFASTIDTLIIYNQETMFRTITITLILASEGISIIDNLRKSGVPIPEKIVSLFENMNDKETK